MAYINALAQISEYFSENWSTTPVVYVNAPYPSIPPSGQYAGCYVRLYGGSSVVESELSEAKRKVDIGIITLDIHVPDGMSYITSDSLVRVAAPLLDNKYYGGVQLGTAEINSDAGYFEDGTHVTRIQVNYVTDYEY